MDTSEKLLNDLPPYLADEPRVQRYAVAQGAEFDRATEMLAELAERIYPHAATDELRILSMWERLLGLPESPTDATIPERQTKVLAGFSARKVSSGAGWVELLTRALGTTIWTHEEGPGDYQISIVYPYGSGGYTIPVVEALARRITPAHLQIIATYEEGFIVGDSFLDPDASVVSDSII